MIKQKEVKFIDSKSFSEKNYRNMRTLSSNLGYSKETDCESSKLGNILISLF